MKQLLEALCGVRPGFQGSGGIGRSVQEVRVSVMSCSLEGASISCE